MGLYNIVTHKVQGVACTKQEKKKPQSTLGCGWLDPKICVKVGMYLDKKD